MNGQLAGGYARAGHNPPRLRSVGGGDVVRPLDGAQGLPLGILAEGLYREGRGRVAGGNAIVPYTDGVAEAVNGRGEMPGDRRLDRGLRGSLGGAGATVGSVLNALDGFTGRRPPGDDRTLIAAAVE